MSDFKAYTPDGRLDMNAHLGRDVVTARDLLEVIRPQLRLARALYRGQLDAIREGWITGDADLEMADAGDAACLEVLFDALRDNARQNLNMWAKDMAAVFDGDKADEFIRAALSSAMTDKGTDYLPEGMLGY